MPRTQRWPLYTAAVLRPFLEQISVPGLGARFWLGDDDLAALLARLDQGDAVLAWMLDDPLAHERALRRALSDAGVDTTGVLALLADVRRLPAAIQHEVVQDVVRFDGVMHAWTALMVERAPDIGLAQVEPSRLDAARLQLPAHLARFTAADGTMRIPARAALLRAAQRSRC